MAEAQAAESCRVVAGSEAPGSPLIGRDVGELAGIGPLAIKVVGDAAAVFEAAEVVLDLTVPAASVAHARLAADRDERISADQASIRDLRKRQISDKTNAR